MKTTTLGAIATGALTILVASFATSAQATSFAVLLSGTSGEAGLDGILSVDIDDIVFDYETVSNITPDLPASIAKDQQKGYVLFRPGRQKPGRIILYREFSGKDMTFRQWRQAVNDGKTDRRSICVIVYSDVGGELERYTFDECEPVKWDVAPDGQTEILTCDIGSITLAGREAAHPVIANREAAHPVIANVQYADGAMSTDTEWDSWSGGELALLNKWIFQGTKYHQNVPGNLSVEPLTLTGDVTGGHQAVFEWLNSAMNGQPWAQTLRIREAPYIPSTPPAKPKPAFLYYDCFPIRYVFPRLSAKTVGGIESVEGLSDTHERIEIKPIRVELK